VKRQVTEAVGGKMIGGWYCLGDYDAILIADVPNIESMAAIAVRLRRVAQSSPAIPLH
jgi:uncharacterized protein with GYD domain